MRCEAADIKSYTNLVKPLNRETRILERGIQEGITSHPVLPRYWQQASDLHPMGIPPGLPPYPSQTTRYLNDSLYIALSHPIIIYSYIRHKTPRPRVNPSVWIYRVGGGNKCGVI